MKLSSKLNALQKLAVRYANEPNKLYLIALLAEHAEEDEVSAEFLVWLEIMLMPTAPLPTLPRP